MSFKSLVLIGFITLIMESNCNAQVQSTQTRVRARPVLTCQDILPPQVARVSTIHQVDGYTLSDGGILNSNPSSYHAGALDESGALIFFSPVNNSARNEGIFKKVGATITALVRGCSAGGGCGDPAPGGGTFRHIYSDSTVFGPSIDRTGGVVFIATVENASYTRAVFRRDAATGVISKILAEGDLAPSGGSGGTSVPPIISRISVGGGNANGVVVLLAQQGDPTSPIHILKYSNGLLTYIAAPGTVVPEGNIVSIPGGIVGDTSGTYTILFEPSINEAGQIAFAANVNTASGIENIIYRYTNGQYVALARQGTSAPGGGVFGSFGQPVINGQGHVAFSAATTGSSSDRGWYVADNNGLRLAAAKGTSLVPYGGQGTIGPLTINTVPFLSLNDCGDLVFHTEAYVGGGIFKDTIVLSKVGGYLEVLGQAGQATPGGGVYSAFNLVPALNNSGSVVLSTLVVGTPVSDKYIVLR